MTHAPYYRRTIREGDRGFEGKPVYRSVAAYAMRAGYARGTAACGKSGVFIAASMVDGVPECEACRLAIVPRKMPCLGVESRDRFTADRVAHKVDNGFWHGGSR